MIAGSRARRFWANFLEVTDASPEELVRLARSGEWSDSASRRQAAASMHPGIAAWIQRFDALELFSSGMNRRQIREHFKLSEAVTTKKLREINDAVGYDVTGRIETDRADANSLRLARTLRAALIEQPGRLRSDFVELSAGDRDAFRRAFPKLLLRFVRNPENSRATKWRRDEILDSLRSAFDQLPPGEWLTIERWSELEADRPSQGRIRQIFGSWSRALDEAGVPYVPPPAGRPRTHVMTADEAIDEVAIFLLERAGESSMTDEWTTHAREHGLPSIVTLLMITDMTLWETAARAYEQLAPGGKHHQAFCAIVDREWPLPSTEPSPNSDVTRER